METELLLSNSVIQGLKHLGTSVPVEQSKKLLENAFKCMLHPEATIPPAAEIYGSESDKAKQAEYGIVALLAEATKHCYDQYMLRQFLESQAIETEVIDLLVNLYNDHRKELTLRQMQIGHNFPHITEVRWRIISEIKSTISNASSGEVSFLINLGRFRADGEYETVLEFLASTEEVQSIISKFKEIERHCEKIANE